MANDTPAATGPMPGPERPPSPSGGPPPDPWRRDPHGGSAAWAPPHPHTPPPSPGGGYGLPGPGGPPPGGSHPYGGGPSEHPPGAGEDRHDAAGQQHRACEHRYGGPEHPYPPPEPQHAATPRRRRRLLPALVLAVVTALLAGGVGGAVGYGLATRAGGGSTSVLGAPLPGLDEAAAPVGPVEAVAAEVLPSVVQLIVRGPGGQGAGSGMVLSPDGLLLTNNHVIAAAAAGGEIITQFQDGTTAPTQIVGRDETSDIAVLRAQNVSGLAAIELGNSDAVRVGQPVVAFGSPLGLGGTVTTGIVSALDRAVSVGENDPSRLATVLSALQTDAAINPGNSGGPLVDMEGRVIGVNSAIATTGPEGGSIGVGFSIPINHAKRIAEELERTGTATRAVLGVNVGGQPDQGLGGAVLGPVVPGGPADQAGIRQGQVVTRVDDRVITNGTELVAAIRDHAPGEQVTLVVDGREVTVTLTGETN